MRLTNQFKIYFDTTLNVPEVKLSFNGGEIITLVKDTALANYISVMEIMLTATEYTNKGLIWPLFGTALYFLAFVGILTLLLGWIERRLNYFR